MLILYLALLITALYYVSKILGPEMAKPSPSVVSQEEGVGKGAEWPKISLVDKDKVINILEQELKMSRAQTRNFDKVQMLLEEEVRRLREQNRIFRSELGLPFARSKENSII